MMFGLGALLCSPSLVLMHLLVIRALADVLTSWLSWTIRIQGFSASFTRAFGLMWNNSYYRCDFNLLGSCFNVNVGAKMCEKLKALEAVVEQDSA
jgi:hypothetical protein